MVTVLVLSALSVVTWRQYNGALSDVTPIMAYPLIRLKLYKKRVYLCIYLSMCTCVWYLCIVHVYSTCVAILANQYIAIGDSSHSVTCIICVGLHMLYNV